MFRFIICLVLCSAIASAAWSNPITPTGELEVKIEKIRNTKGEVRVALFKSQDGFPDKPEKAYEIIKAHLTQTNITVIFRNLPYGEYAIGLLHDENGDGKMEMNYLSIPKEGYGASNNAVGFFGPPSFAAAKLKLAAAKQSISIDMRY